VFLRDGALMAVPFDLGTMQTVGTPVEVLTGVRQTSFGAFSCSRNGSCVYVAGSAPAQRRVALVDRTGAVRLLPLPPGSYTNPRFSPAGDKLSFWLGGRRCDVEIYDVTGGRTTKLTSENDNHSPVWAPDGQRLAYISYKPGSPGYALVSRSVTGAGAEERLGPSSYRVGAVAQLSWSPMGTLVFADRAGRIGSQAISCGSCPGETVRVWLERFLAAGN
jgi:Tol biopolymer transport system component